MKKIHKIYIAIFLSIVLFMLLDNIKDFFIIMSALFIERLLDN